MDLPSRGPATVPVFVLSSVGSGEMRSLRDALGFPSKTPEDFRPYGTLMQWSDYLTTWLPVAC